MLVPVRKIVFIIDALSFRRARLERFLSSWADDENIELISLQPDEAHRRLIEHDCHMMIYSVGGALFAHEVLAEIQVLRTLCPKAALAIVSDDESPTSIISTLNCGAQGYFSSSMDPALAVQAFSFLLRGGTYYPPTVLAGQTTGGTPMVEHTHHKFLHDMSQPRQFGSSMQHGQVSSAGQAESMLQQQGSLFDDGTDTGRNHETVAVRDHPGLAARLTERQQSVLACLCLGDPNKVIGRKLGMTETTVKVHVREIMRKLGVCNRTQVAVAAGRARIIPASGVELASPDPSATVN